MHLRLEYYDDIFKNIFLETLNFNVFYIWFVYLCIFIYSKYLKKGIIPFRAVSTHILCIFYTKYSTTRTCMILVFIQLSISFFDPFFVLRRAKPYNIFIVNEILWPIHNLCIYLYLPNSFKIWFSLLHWSISDKSRNTHLETHTWSI